MFISTSAEINTGGYLFNAETDVRIEADAFIYHLSSVDTSALKTIEWITSRFKGEINSIGNANLEVNLSAKGSLKHHLNQILYGAPGTGKTYHSVAKAVEICGFDTNGKSRDEIKSPPLVVALATTLKLKKSKRQKMFM